MSEPRDTPANGQVGAIAAVEAALEGVVGAVSLAPSSIITPAIGGELVLATGETSNAATASDDVSADSVRAGILQAGPLAIAGLVANGANVIVTVLLARLLSSRGYGALNQLTGLFLIVSMPGSAVIVGVVRHVTAAKSFGASHLVRRWAGRVHRQGTVFLVGFAVVVLVSRNFLAHTIGQRNAVGAAAILVAGAFWILLSLDRGLLQAHRDYRLLAINLLVEGGVRTVCMLALVGAGFGAGGAAVGVLIAEVVTTGHARLAAMRAWGHRNPNHEGVAAGSAHTWLRAHAERWIRGLRGGPINLSSVRERRDLLVDLGAALVALAMVALLQNIDVIVLGRDAPSVSGSYAAVSVASKALVFGAIVLGGYLLPEAAIRWHEGGHALRQLSVTFLLLAIPTMALLVLSLFAPHFLLSLVFSARYLGAQRAFAPLVVAMIFLSITVILTMYLLAVGRRWITGLLVFGAVALTVVVASAHGNPRSTAIGDLSVQGGLAVLTLIGFVKVHHRRLQEQVD